MTPGYYSVPLRDRGVLVEFKATQRTGLHRYTFHSTGASHFVLDFSHSYNDPLSPVSDATLDIVGEDMVTGGRTVHAWAKGRKIYFAAQFSKPFSRADCWQEGAVLPGGTRVPQAMPLRRHCTTTPAPGRKFLSA